MDLPRARAGRLERSCGPHAADYIRFASSRAGLERIEAAFTGHAYDPHRHDTYAIGYTLHGVQSFGYRGAVESSAVGQVIVLHPDEVHDGRAGVEEGFRYRMVYVEPRLIRAALDERVRTLPFSKAAVLNDPRLRAILTLVLADLDEEVSELQQDQFIAELADALSRHDGAPARSGTAGFDMPALDRARALLDATAGEAVSSADLESITGLDRFTLARQFRQAFGTSPYRYLTMRRLDRARALIRAGKALADAAAEAGFADQSHLTRQFKKAFGVSPGQWRGLQAG